MMMQPDTADAGANPKLGFSEALLERRYQFERAAESVLHLRRVCRDASLVESH